MGALTSNESPTTNYTWKLKDDKDIRIQVLSDTHIEFWKNDADITSIKRLPPPLNDLQPVGNILALLGDIGCPYPGTNGVNLYQEFLADVRYLRSFVRLLPYFVVEFLPVVSDS
jgi:hypothetical protein